MPKLNTKSIPRLQFIVSLAFYEHFIFGHSFSKIKLEFFLKQTENFENFFKNYEAKLLNLIQKYLGSKWSEKDIEIHLFFPLSNQEFPSIAHPLLLCWKRDKYLMLHILVHELIHRYIFYDKNFNKLKLSSFQAEVISTLVANKIIRTLFGKAVAIRLCKNFTKIIKTDDIETILMAVREIEGRWNLKRMPILYYLNKDTIRISKRWG